MRLRSTLRSAARAAALSLPVLALACAGPRVPEDLKGMAEETSQGENPDGASMRIERVLDMTEAGELVTPEDHLNAAIVLMDSSDPVTIDVARDLAFAAAQMGDDRGLSLGAEAIDIARLKRGLPQKFGTQYFYDFFRERWVLFTWDTTTTDDERLAFGLPTLAEAMAKLEWLNGPDGPTPARPQKPPPSQ